jgi:hypothetical protein
MGYLLYVGAAIIIIGLAVGFFAYSAVSIFHLLLVIALITIFLRAVEGIKPI